MIDFKEVKVSSSKMRERNDCAVKALAIVASKPYEEIHALMKSLGRKDRRGTSRNIVWKAAQKLNPEVGYEAIRKPNGRYYTARTIGEALPKGNYMILYRGHLAAMVDGMVEDWTDGRCHRVLAVYKM
jgi:hypothetical protein